ncbi:MAG: cyclopropane-fatty-acyl-phospholipid synthase [Bacteroidetes bacterium]|nr:MAG: cyclopropane-fatty-acyl-phospholipid synthase [Bacteroidota bacterium]
MNIDSLLEKGRLPDFLIRAGIRRLLRQRLREEAKNYARPGYEEKLFGAFGKSPLAVNTAEANEQHYEVPTEFYKYCLGTHLKYSGCFWKPGVHRLDEAERDMLGMVCERAQLDNGQDVLELGCGWGSLSLFMSAKFPGSRFTVVSNSRTQKEYIDAQAVSRGIKNLEVITSDINVFDTEKKFDRAVSVEMFEHMRNHGLLLERIAGWLKEDGKLFVHIFVHKTYTYLFEAKDESDWMSRYFFTGGMMPGDRYLYAWNKHLQVKSHWPVNGVHYAKTAEAWLQNMDAHKKEIIPLFENTYGKSQARKWWNYWRVFYMACAELWGYKKGEEWFVSHYLLEKK